MQKDLDILAKISHIRVKEGYANDQGLRKYYLNIYSQFDFEMLLSIFDDVYNNNNLLARFGEDTRRIFFDYFQKSQQVILSIIFKVLISSYNTNNILNRDLMFTKRFEVQANDAYIIMKTLINNIDDKLNYNLKDYIGEIGYVAYNLLPSALSFENYRIGIYSDLSLMHANTIIVFIKITFLVIIVRYIILIMIMTLY